MKFRALTALLCGAVILGLTTGIANAGMVPDVNCAALSGDSKMCVKNASNYPVVAIQATTSMSFGDNWINIPGGSINPGGTTIVKFPVWGNGCYQNVFVKTMNRQTHMFPHVDVCHSTSFIIQGW